MNIKIALFLTLAGFTVSRPAFAQRDKRLKGIERDFEKILEITQAPGFAVAIVEGSKTVYSRGFGYRDLEKKLPMDENTLMPIGSCTKAFTGAILGQLREEGKLSFYEHPAEYVHGLTFPTDELNRGVTIRDLMTHQTGIPRHDISWYLFPADNKDSLVQRIQYLKHFAGLRQKWGYNNFMFVTLGVISERITKKTWEENISERFFEPLGMEHSNLSVEALEQNDNAAFGYDLHNNTSQRVDYFPMGGMAPSGGINSSVKEMANWLKVWINQGAFGEKQILPEVYVKDAMSSQAVISSSPQFTLRNNGYGWEITYYKGHYKIEHEGGIDGFTANVAFYPDMGIGVIVLANQHQSSIPYLVRNTVSDRMLEEIRTDWSGSYQKENAEKEQKKVSEITNEEPLPDLHSYTGSYFHPGYGRFNIEVKKDSLFASFQRVQFYLMPVRQDVFEPLVITESGASPLNRELHFNFSARKAGEIESVMLDLEPALRHLIEFMRELEVGDSG